jgi:hypothetical protein
MIAPKVFRPNEISLFGTYFPILGPALPFLASTLADKEIYGENTDVDDEDLYSTWKDQNNSGGIGIKDMIERDPRIIANRCWWSDCHLETEGHMLLPALTVKTTNPGVEDPAVTGEYANAQYAAFATAFHRWAESTATWGSSLGTLVAIPTDIIVHKSKQYLACGSDFNRWDGSTLTTGTALSVGAATAHKAVYFIEWDGKLLSIDNTGQLSFSIDEGVTWINNALSPLEDDSFTSLFVYRLVTDEYVPHLGTKEGMFSLDFDNREWVETQVTGPRHDFTGRGADKWRTFAFVPSGLQVTQYDTSGDPSQGLMGLDRDDGILGNYRGSIVDLVPSQHELFAILDATSTLLQELYPAATSPGSGNVYGDVQIYDSEGYSGVFRWNGVAWYIIHLAGASATPAKTGSVSTSDGINRLWFAIDSNMYYMALQDTLQNPKEISTFEYQLSGEHIATWFNARNEVITKTAARFNIRVEGMSSTETVKVYYGLNGDDDTWTLLTNSDYTDGIINTDGTHEFTFAIGLGVEFESIRFRYVLVRGTVSTKVSPDIRWTRLSYLKQLTVRYGWRLRVDCSRNYRRKRASTLEAALKSALGSGIMGPFSFKKSESHNVMVIPPFQGTEIGGPKDEGVFDIIVVAP